MGHQELPCQRQVWTGQAASSSGPGLFFSCKLYLGDRKQVGWVAPPCLPQSQSEYMINRSQSHGEKGVNQKGDAL